MRIDLSHYGLPNVERDDATVSDESFDGSDRDVYEGAPSAPRRRSIWRTLSVATVGLLATLAAWALPSQTDQSLVLVPQHFFSTHAISSSRQYEPIIRHYAQWYGVDPALLTAMIRVESSFNPRAVSDKGALGLMQLMPDTIAYWRITDPLNPYQNIRGGALQIRYLLHRFSDNLELAIAAYHAGATHVTRHDGIPPFPSTHQYVQRVLEQYQRLRPAASREL